MRRSLFLGSTTLGTASLALNSTRAAAATNPGPVPGGTDLVEPLGSFEKRSFDQRVGRPAEYRVLWEAAAYVPAFLNNVKNSLNGLQFGYGTDPSQILTVVAAHGPSSAYNYTDYLWAKYRIGEYFGIKDAAGMAITSNTFLPAKATSTSRDPNDEHSTLQDTSVSALQARGVLFLTCHTAVEEQARGIVKRSFAPEGMLASAVAADILTHLVPNVVVVPSMVATIAYLQVKFNYAYLTVQ